LFIGFGGGGGGGAAIFGLSTKRVTKLSVI